MLARLEAAQRRRRKEHQDRLEQQAQARRKSGKTPKAHTNATAAAAAEEALRTPVSADNDYENLPLPTTVGPASRKRRFDLLPAEILETLSDADTDSDGEVAGNQGPPSQHPVSKKRRLDREQAELRRQLRDQQVGSTIYRVAPPKDDAGMAPKMSKASRNLKTGLMIRNRVAQRRGGFWRANRASR
jgi:hypothetical protein